MSSNPAETKTPSQAADFEIKHAVHNVSEVFQAPRLAPEKYPGEHPESPCSLLDGDTLYRLRWNEESTLFLNRGSFDPVLDTTRGPLSLDEYLHSKGVPTLAERYPLTVFGSNRSPGQLLDKFRKPPAQADAGHGEMESTAELEITPMFMGTLKGYDAVYNAGVGNLGYFFADLYQGPETQDTEIEVAVLFLTKEQLKKIHETEKAYDFKLLGNVEIGQLMYGEDEGETLKMPAFAHVGKATAYAEEVEGRPRPIALSEIYAKGRSLTALGQTELQDRVFSNDPEGKKAAALEQITGSSELTSASFMDNMKMERAGGRHNLATRRELQKLLNEAMGEEEKMVIDPDQFGTAETVDLGTHTLPDRKSVV